MALQTGRESGRGGAQCWLSYVDSEFLQQIIAILSPNRLHILRPDTVIDIALFLVMVLMCNQLLAVLSLHLGQNLYLLHYGL